MIKITHVVQEIVSDSEIAFSALQTGVLNLSAYAKTIQREVEKRTKKPVQLGSVIIALSRLRPTIKKAPSLIPPITIDGLAVRSSLVEIAFDRTDHNMSRLRDLYKDKQVTSADFFTVTQGTAEITVICSEASEQHIIKSFKPQKPKIVIQNLVGLTVRLTSRYIQTPNTFYALMRQLAMHKINIIELVSTYTEITFILEEKYLQQAFNLLHESFKPHVKY